MPQEAAATSEALEAERAAKFAADAEARELQRVLDEVRLGLGRPSCWLVPTAVFGSPSSWVADAEARELQCARLGAFTMFNTWLAS